MNRLAVLFGAAVLLAGQAWGCQDRVALTPQRYVKTEAIHRPPLPKGCQRESCDPHTLIIEKPLPPPRE
jgi:hypothetical protein